MPNSKLFTIFRGVTWGCGVTIVAFLPLVATISTLQALGLSPNLLTYSWLIAVAVGGYFSCRQANATAWINCIVFAAITETLVLSQGRDANENLAQMFPNADVQWHYSTMVFFTLPAALLGGIFWNIRNKVKDKNKSQD